MWSFEKLDVLCPSTKENRKQENTTILILYHKVRPYVQKSKNVCEQYDINVSYVF